jgi:hypothetical protein
MTPDEVAAIAKRVGFPIQHPEWRKAVEEFAALVEEQATALEREACAKVCDDLPPPDGYNMTEISFWDVTSLECAEAIRARGRDAA